MRLHEIENPMDIEDRLSTDPKLIDLGKQIFQAKYPDVHLEVNYDENSLMTGMDHGRGKPEFMISYLPVVQETENGLGAGITIMDAYSGEYRGVIGELVKVTTEYVLSKVPGAIPILAIESDESTGAWEHIANKLGYELTDYE